MWFRIYLFYIEKNKIKDPEMLSQLDSDELTSLVVDDQEHQMFHINWIAKMKMFKLK